MPRQVAVAIIHGVGIQGPDFAEPMIKMFRKRIIDSVGTEYDIVPDFAIRAGYGSGRTVNGGLGGTQRVDEFSTGFGLRLRSYDLDYAIVLSNRARQDPKVQSRGALLGRDGKMYLAHITDDAEFLQELGLGDNVGQVSRGMAIDTDIIIRQPAPAPDSVPINLVFP